MVYVSNAPFLIMEKGGMSGDTFEIIFAINSLGLMMRTSGPVVTLKRLPYPGTPLTVGSSGSAVLYYSLLLQRIAYYFTCLLYTSIPVKMAVVKVFHYLHAAIHKASDIVHHAHGCVEPVSYTHLMNKPSFLLWSSTERTLVDKSSRYHSLIRQLI